MTETEDRLRHAFAELDRQVTLPERRAVVPRRRVGLAAVAAAAAVVALLAGGAVLVSTADDNGEIGVSAGGGTPAAFNERADELCRHLIAERTGRAPRFATDDAYRVVAEQRLALIAVARAELEAIAAPSDDVGLPSRADAHFERAEDRARAVVTLAVAGNVEDAQRLWAAVDSLIDNGLAVLERHGAAECRP